MGTLGGLRLTDDGWRQAKLPVKHGGLGVLSASDIALPAFLASVFGSAELGGTMT